MAKADPGPLALCSLSPLPGFIALEMLLPKSRVQTASLFPLYRVPLTSVRLGPCHTSGISGWAGVQGTPANDVSLTRVDLQVSLHVLHAVGSLELAA